MPVAAPAVTLEFMLVSGEETVAEAVQTALEEIGAAVTSASAPDVAADLVTSCKVDGVVLDADIKTSLDLISRMRRSKNARAFAFVCVNNDAEEAVALKGGATATLPKPLDPRAVSAKIKSFKSIIISERRRYQRIDVTLPVVLALGESTYQGIIENISQGGMAVQLPCILNNSSVVEFSFEFDGGMTIEGDACIRWTRPDGLTGMEFRLLPPRCKDDLMAWLREQAAVKY